MKHIRQGIPRFRRSVCVGGLIFASIIPPAHALLQEYASRHMSVIPGLHCLYWVNWTSVSWRFTWV